MRLKIIAALMAATIFALFAHGTTSSAPPPTTPADDIVKGVFVHYPHQPDPQDARGGARGGGGGASSCPDPTTCTDNKWSGQKWTGAISVTVDLTGSSLSAIHPQNAITNAFVTWGQFAPNGSVVKSIGVTFATTDCAAAGASRNNINQVCWRDLGSSFSNALAVTFVWYSRATKQIVEADTVFSTTVTWDTLSDTAGVCTGYSACNSDDNSSLTVYDVRDVATHEFGHFLAYFGDLYSGQDAQLTMYGYAATGEQHKDSLGKGDCLGIVAAYGGSCP